jgi:MFS family permease
MELGIDESTASYTLGFMGLATFLGTLTMGVASERFGRKLPVVLSFAIRSVSICVPLLAKSVIGYYTFLILLGVSFFGMVPVISAWFSEVFGKEVVGSLFGFSQLIHLIGSALGIYFLSYMAEISGTYFPALIVCLALTLINILLSLLVSAPARHAEWS